DDDVLIERVLTDLRETMGLHGAPREVRIGRLPGSFPQYRPGHLGRVEAVDTDLATSAPGLVVAGAALRGPGVPACSRQGRAAPAERRLCGHGRPRRPGTGGVGIMEVGPGPSPSWRRRALVVAIAALLAASGGVLAAYWERPSEVVAGAEPPPVAPAPAEPDLTPVGSTGARIVAALSANLPVPEPVPADARAATPEVRHGMLEIPAIGLSQPLFEGVTLTAIDRGPSHWPGTAMPGELGNVVVAGHRTTRTRPFWDLDLLQPG